jgi:hypothetical protein
MDLMNEDFAAGAIAVSNEELIIDFIAAGNMESVVFTWYRICDPNSEQCVIALYGDDGVTSIEKCDAEDNEDLTRALLKTLNFGANTEDFESEAWLCVLDDGHVNSQFVDKSILRKTLEAGAAQLDSEFNFEQWAQKSGYSNDGNTN